MTMELLKYPNVIGFGTGFKISDGWNTGRRAKVVLVTEKLPTVQLGRNDRIPFRWDGEETDVVPVGIIRALQSRMQKWRPAPGGVSIGHYAITAGTLGCIVRDVLTDRWLILSNNHVLANSNDAQMGDPILQPGPVDGGTSADLIASLSRFVPIVFDGQGPPTGCIPGLIAVLAAFWKKGIKGEAAAMNRVDAAVAQPGNFDDVADYIYEIGNVRGTKQATLGLQVRKSGRTTGFTQGEVQLIDAVVQVSYGAGKVATFEKQIVTSNMSKGGDSGSLLVDGSENTAVGLLFAGSDAVTIFNPIEDVLTGLGVTL